MNWLNTVNGTTHNLGLIASDHATLSCNLAKKTLELAKPAVGYPLASGPVPLQKIPIKADHRHYFQLLKMTQRLFIHSEEMACRWEIRFRWRERPV